VHFYLKQDDIICFSSRDNNDPSNTKQCVYIQYLSPGCRYTITDGVLDVEGGQVGVVEWLSKQELSGVSAQGEGVIDVAV
jgi:hypothetical protein